MKTPLPQTLEDISKLNAETAQLRSENQRLISEFLQGLRESNEKMDRQFAEYERQRKKEEKLKKSEEKKRKQKEEQMEKQKEKHLRKEAEQKRKEEEQKRQVEEQKRKEEEKKRQEEEQKRKEEDQKRQEEEKKRREDYKRQQKESTEKWDKQFAEELRLRLLDREQMIELKKELRGIGISNGNFAEEYFSNSFFYDQKNFFGERFDYMRENLNGRRNKQGLTDEYDIVLFNCTSVAILEVKYKARHDNLDQVLRKSSTFRLLYPEYSKCKIYLGLAAMVFSPEMEKLCRDNGVAVIKQVGENVVIIDNDVKVF